MTVLSGPFIFKPLTYNTPESTSITDWGDEFGMICLIVSLPLIR